MMNTVPVGSFKLEVFDAGTNQNLAIESISQTTGTAAQAGFDLTFGSTTGLLEGSPVGVSACVRACESMTLPLTELLFPLDDVCPPLQNNFIPASGVQTIFLEFFMVDIAPQNLCIKGLEVMDDSMSLIQDSSISCAAANLPPSSPPPSPPPSPSGSPSGPTPAPLPPSPPPLPAEIIIPFFNGLFLEIQVRGRALS